VGWHVAEAFAREGWSVRGIVRQGSGKPVPDGVLRVEAELTDPSLSRACEGSDVLLHSAALIRARDQATFDAVNVGGTRAALHAARACGARMVLISSQAAGGDGTRDHPRTEADTPAPVNAYGRSKLAAEMVLRAASDVRWTILRPCAVFGPRDRGFLTLFRMVRRGIFLVPTPADTWFTLIFVGDLVRAVQAAVESGAAIGETFFVGHREPRTGRDLLRAIARAEQRPFRPWPVPAALLSALALCGDFAWKLGVEPLVDSSRLAELRARGFVCSVEHIREVLGFEAQTALEDGVAQTAQWYRDRGWTQP
jgi:nucleoside-diphosphate-sugar epimerase